jgi:hypothetical protein
MFFFFVKDFNNFIFLLNKWDILFFSILLGESVKGSVVIPKLISS